MRQRWFDQWAHMDDVNARECLWIRIKILDDLFLELQQIAEGDNNDGPGTSAGDDAA